MAKLILREKSKAGGSHFWFNTYYKAIVIETVWHQHKNGHIGQQNRESRN